MYTGVLTLLLLVLLCCCYYYSDLICILSYFTGAEFVHVFVRVK